MGRSKIEWLQGPDGRPGRVWNPTVGCTRVSDGCRNCYAERMGARVANAAQARIRDGGTPTPRQRAYLGAMRFERGGVNGPADENDKALPRWSGAAPQIGEALEAPLGWRDPCHVFVNSQSDLFHETISDEFRAAVFAVMAATPHLTYIILTKRPQAAARWFEWLRNLDWPERSGSSLPSMFGTVRGDGSVESYERHADRMWAIYIDHGWAHADGEVGPGWPLPNVVLGTSVEDQDSANDRIPALSLCDARGVIVSYEPALGPVDWFEAGAVWQEGDLLESFVDQIIIGGESGPRARPYCLAWFRETVRQFRPVPGPGPAHTRIFHKQLGRRPVADVAVAGEWIRVADVKDKKGGRMDEWPRDLRIREPLDVTAGRPS